jgi:hypothetical protein
MGHSAAAAFLEAEGGTIDQILSSDVELRCVSRTSHSGFAAWHSTSASRSTKTCKYTTQLPAQELCFRRTQMTTTTASGAAIQHATREGTAFPLQQIPLGPTNGIIYIR